MKKLGVDALPAIVGWLSNGEKHILRTGVTVKDLKSAIQDLSELLEGFEKTNKKASSAQSKRAQTESAEKQIPLLTVSNFDALCSESTPVCVIGAFRSPRGRERLESIISDVSNIFLSWYQSFQLAILDAISRYILNIKRIHMVIVVIMLM